MSFARPDTIFEANFFNSGDGQAWTNLSDYVELNQGVDISMRRQLVFNDVAAGTMTLYLDNSTGIFNNDRNDLPYFGLVNVDTPVRYRIRWPNLTPVAPFNSNPYFAGTSGTGWSGFNGTLSISSSPPSGSPYPNAAFFTITTASAGAALEENNADFPVSGSTYYRVSAWVYTAQTTVTIGFDWRNAGGAYISSSTLTVPVPANTWTQVVTEQEAPSNAFTAYPRIAPTDGVSNTIYVTGVLCDAASYAPNMLTTAQSLVTNDDDFIAEQGSLDQLAAGTTYTIQSTATDNTSLIVTDADGKTLFVGQQFIPDPASFTYMDDESIANMTDEATNILLDEDASSLTTPTVHTITSISPASGGFRTVTCTPHLPTPAPSGGTFTVINNAMTWATGLLQTTGVHLLTGDFFARSADDYPMYVKPSTQYSAQVQAICDTAGTGISFQVSARIIWYDKTGAYISESAGTPVTLSTGPYTRVSVTATSPSNAYTARMALANETLVNPSSASIALTGYSSDAVNRGGEITHLPIPVEANVGDLALAWHYCNSQPTFSLPSGWTLADTWTDSRGKAQLAYKILTQADINTVVPWTINQTGKRWLALLATFSGANLAAPINAHTTSAETVYRTGHTPPSITTTVANCWLVNALFDTSSTNALWTPAAGFNLIVDRYCTGGNAATGIVASNETGVTAAVHAGSSYSASVSSKFASMSTVAIAPATTTGPDSVLVSVGGWQLEQSSAPTTFTPAGSWLDLHTGYLDSLSKTFDGDLSLMQVQSTDASKRLSTLNIGSAVDQAIRFAAPLAYFKLNESGDTATTQGANSSTTYQSAIKAIQVGTGGTLAWGGGTGPDVDGTVAVKTTKLTAANGLYLRAALDNPLVGSSSCTLMCWFNSTDNDTSVILGIIKAVSLGTGTTQRSYVEIRGNSGTNMQADAYISSDTASAGTLVATDSTDYFDGKTHMLLGTYQIVGGNLIVSLYVDGVQTATNSIACAPFTTFPPLDTLSVGDSYISTNICSGTYSYAALFDGVVDDDTIADIYTAGKTAYAGDFVHERIARICNWAGIGSTNLETSDITCDRHMPDDKSVMDAIKQAAKSDGGTSFVNGSGAVEFKARLDKETTFDTWLNVDTRYVQPAMAEITDDQLLVNKAVITRLAAATKFTSANQTSINAHGTYEQDIDTIMDSDVEAQNDADYLTAFYSEPTTRCDNIVIEAQFLQDWSAIINQDMWQIVTITNLPSIEESSTTDLYVEGWEHQIDDQTWNITYDTSAAIPFAVLDDAVRGVVGNVVVAW